MVDVGAGQVSLEAASMLYATRVDCEVHKGHNLLKKMSLSHLTQYVVKIDRVIWRSDHTKLLAPINLDHKSKILDTCRPECYSSVSEELLETATERQEDDSAALVVDHEPESGSGFDPSFSGL